MARLDEYITFRAPKAVSEELRRVAEQRDRPLSYVAREMIAAGLKQSSTGAARLVD